MIHIKKYVFLILTVMWISMIFYMSSKPGDESARTSLKIVDVIVEKLNLTENQIDKVHFAVRKTAHFTEYFILSFLVASTYSEFYNKKLNISLVLLVCLLVATSDEFLQSFIEGRGSQVKDVLIDFSGSLTQLIAFITIRANVTKKHKRNKYIG
ncbi:VanZ family protein [Clostridium tunisiense]|uniref:VanZ family protein n=1 Tax=Clostridium tunisiense TaxID=219748 RepID=UPI000A00D755|nr:VanZ family protein [Clostridium tunisiense]